MAQTDREVGGVVKAYASQPPTPAGAFQTLNLNFSRPHAQQFRNSNLHSSEGNSQMEAVTQSQQDQSTIAQHEFEEVLDRLVTEGMDYRAILAGAGTAIAHSISVSSCPKKVPQFFAQWSELTKDFGKDVDNK